MPYNLMDADIAKCVTCVTETEEHHVVYLAFEWEPLKSNSSTTGADTE